MASQVGVGGGARAGSAAGPAACAGTRRPEMAAPGLRLCAAAALLLLLLPRLPLRARADEHEHTVRRVPASPGSARAAAPASPPTGPAAAEGRRRPGERGPGSAARWAGGAGPWRRAGGSRPAGLLSRLLRCWGYCDRAGRAPAGSRPVLPGSV